ncbi:MAG: hypothetical protein K8S56_05095 [Candidatus Cloacimonetes bacterium]|nr:hypothetical protein [Candidatus Cloacimonadota bacterium]
MEAIAELRGLKNEPKQLFRKLYKMKYGDFENNEVAFNDLILELNIEHNFDFCKLGLEAIQSGYNCFPVAHIVSESFGKFKLEIQSVLDLFKKLNDEMKNDMASNTQYELSTSLAKNNPIFAVQFLKKCAEIEDDFVVGHISTIYKEFSLNDFSAIHCDIMNRLQTYDGIFFWSLINTLGILNYENHNHELDISVEFLIKAIKQTNHSELHYIAFSLIRLYEFSNNVTEHILGLKNRNIPDVDFHISNFLFRNAKKIIDGTWFDSILLKFCNTKDSHQGITNNLDSVLQQVIEKGKNDLFLSFFLKWYEQPDRDIKEHNIRKEFPLTIATLFKQEQLLSQIITRFFNHDNFIFHDVASQILTMELHQENQKFHLDVEYLSSLTDEDYRYICRKILGHLFDTKVICSLLFSSLSISGISKSFYLTLTGTFLELLAKDDPHHTKDFAEERLKDEQNNVLQKKLCQNILSIISQNSQQLNQLPRHKEFDLPFKYSLQIEKEKNKEMSKSLENSREQSIFALVMKTTPIKFGKGCFSFQNEVERYSEPTYMSEFSHTITIPISEVCYPVYSAYQRFRFIFISRSD